MRLFRPVKTNHLTQGFGEKNTNPLLLSLYQSLGLKGHNGYDWRVENCQPTGCKIYSPYFKMMIDGVKCEPVYWDCDIAGVVVELSQEYNEGFGVVVLTEDKDGIFKHRFWHLAEISCQVGQRLESGDLIGYTDNTGMSTGSHLHRDLKKLVRLPDGRLENAEPDNGYLGATDLTPYFSNIFILDYIAMLRTQLSLLERTIDVLKKLIKLKIEVKVKTK